MDYPRSVLKLRQAVRAVLDTTEATHVVVAYSGGPDSLSLAHALYWEAPAFPVVCSAVIVDHGVTADSARRTQDAVQLVADLMPVDVKTVELPSTSGPEGGARQVRYEAIADYARSLPGKPLVLLGHTLDDQAETVLLGLSRGSGPRSIAGMKALSVLPETTDIACARPFLALEKATLLEALASWETSWIEDPTNRVDGPWRTAGGELLRRNALRHEAIPALSKALATDVRYPLARTASLLQDDCDFLDEYVHQLYETKAGPVLEIAAGQYHRAIESRLIRLWLIDNGARPGELSFTHISAVAAIIGKPGKTLHIPGVNVATSDRGLTTS